MATTTTNYGFDIPQSTDLVKDGATAIATLGQDIDTAMNTALGTKKAGMVLLNTTSFSAVASVSFAASTFTSTYDNYQILYTLTSSSANTLSLRLRNAGADITTSNYFVNGVHGGGSILNVSTSGTSWQMPTGTARTAVELTLFSPNLAEATQGNFRAYDSNLGNYYNTQLYFNLTTQVDSLSLFPSTGTITGRYSVYGFNK